MQLKIFGRNVKYLMLFVFNDDRHKTINNIQHCKNGKKILIKHYTDVIIMRY